jgi:hypothetical protein
MRRYPRLNAPFPASNRIEIRFDAAHAPWASPERALDRHKSSTGTRKRKPIVPHRSND